MSNYNPTEQQPTGCFAYPIIGAGLILLLFFIFVCAKAGVQNTHQQRSIDELQGRVTTLDASVPPSADHDGSYVALSGELRTDEVLHDADFHISQRGLKLIREVKIYQTMKYSDIGDQKHESSSYFINEWLDAPVVARTLEFAMHLSYEERNKNANEGSELFYQNATMLPQRVTLSAYDVSAAIIQHARWDGVASARILPQSQWSESTQAQGIVRDNALYLRKGGFTEQQRATPAVYQPLIGDLRLRWRYIPNEQEVTLIAQQEGTQLKPIQTSGHDDFFILEQGRIDAPSHLAREEEATEDFSSQLGWFMFFFFWPCYAIILWGIRFGTRQIALWEGWMASYRYASAALMAGVTTSTLHSLIMLYQGRWMGLAVLALSLALGYYLTRKALKKGKTLIFTGPTRLHHDENTPH